MNDVREWVYPIVMTAIALQTLAFGLRGLLTRRPFVISTGWITLPLCVLLGLMLVDVTDTLMSTDGRPFFTFTTLPLLVVAGAMVLFRQTNSYVAFGVTESSLRDALTTSFDSLGVRYEERLGQLQLVPGGAVQVAVQGWHGTGQLRGTTPQARASLREAVTRMNAYFRSNAVDTNLFSCVFNLLMGIALLAVVASLMRDFSEWGR